MSGTLAAADSKLDALMGDAHGDDPEEDTLEKQENEGAKGGAEEEEEEEAEEAEVDSAEKVMADLGVFEYKVRLIFTKTHHQDLVKKAERKKMMQRIDEAMAMGRSLGSSEGEDILLQSNKILAILWGNEYIGKDGKAKHLKRCLEHADACGWDLIAEEPWRPDLVAKAAKVAHAQAVDALKETDDLNEAIKAAPGVTSRLSVRPDGAAPPTRPARPGK